MAVSCSAAPHDQLMRQPGPYLHVANLQLVDNRELQSAKLEENSA